ncbi:MAG TPA: amidohydrolase family protein [Acidimicrobiales bacterium]
MTSPAFVDHHVHLLRVATRARPPYDVSTPQTIAAYHRAVAARGSTPMDADPEPAGVDDVRAALRDALARASDLGLVGVTEAGMRDWAHWDALLALREREELAVAVRVLVASGAARDVARVVDASAANDARVAIAGVKLYADGWLGPRTCACSEAFGDVDPPDTGVLFLDAEALARRVEPLAAAGLRPATHAIGDRAIESALDAYERVYGGQHGCRAARPRIEHAQLLRRDLVERIVELGVVCCIQPCFAASDAKHVDATGFRDRYPLAYRWDALLDAGARVIAGSDFPIETLDPHAGLAALTTGPHALDEATALRLMTVPLDDA